MGWSTGKGVWLALILAVGLAACGGELYPLENGPGGGGGNTRELSTVEVELLETLNAERTARGFVAVTIREDLRCSVRRHSDDVGAVGLCSHTGTDGSDPGVRVEDCGGGGWSGEILACGQQTPRAAVDGWLSSPGHNATMLDPAQREVGVAMHNNYWTAIFDQ